MSNTLYVNYNGTFFKDNENIFGVENRAFRYGDALFETIRVVNGKPCFIEDHFKRLKKGMSILKMKSSSISFKELQTQLENLLIKNKIEEGGRVRITVFRVADGLYTPKNEKKSYVIEANPLKSNDYILNDRGLKIDVFNEYKRNKTALSQIKTTNNIPHILSGIFKEENNLDDCIILNEQGRIAEAISSNIFLIKNNSIYTPGMDEGCMLGVMRKQVLRISEELKYNVFEGMLTGSMLLQADEIFLTNAISGLLWVKEYRNKKYTNKTIKTILDRLNEGCPL